MGQLLLVFACFGAILYFVETSDAAKEREAARKARDEAAKQPHVIREVDGCKVYRFLNDDGRYVIFTRCPESTDTQQTRSESCGKGCSRTVTDSVTTTNGKNP